MKFVKISVLFILITALSSVAFAQDAGGIRGKVRTTRGDGVSGVTITARQNGEDVKSVLSDGSGKFVLNNLQSGVYNIVFSKDGYSSGLKYDVEVAKDKIRDLGDRLILTVDQGTQVIIKGSVYDREGRSIAGARVEIERILTDGTTKKLGFAYTSNGSDSGVRGGDGNSRGDFTFKFSQGAAKYRVTASVKEFAASKEVEVSSAAIYRLALTLEAKKEK